MYYIYTSCFSFFWKMSTKPNVSPPKKTMKVQKGWAKKNTHCFTRMLYVNKILNSPFWKKNRFSRTVLMIQLRQNSPTCAYIGQNPRKWKLHYVGTRCSLVFFCTLLKLETFAILFFYNMLVSVKKSKQTSLLKRQRCKKVRRQMAWAWV